MITGLTAWGGEIGRQLQAILPSLRPEQEVPFIVTLSDKIDLSLFEIVRNEKKSARRSRIVNALKEEKGTGYFLVEKISPIIRNYKNKK